MQEGRNAYRMESVPFVRTKISSGKKLRSFFEERKRFLPFLIFGLFKQKNLNVQKKEFFSFKLLDSKFVFKSILHIFEKNDFFPPKSLKKLAELERIWNLFGMHK